MVNLTNILGTMMATGMGGRSSRGSGFAAAPMGLGSGSRGGGGVGQTAGLAALGYLAYKTYRDYQANNPSSAQAGRFGQTSGGSPQPQAFQGGDSLMDRLTGMLRPEQRARPESALDDRKSLLLIRAMVAAANADGQISADERQRILSRLDDAGASAEDHRFLEQELDRPQSIDTLIREVTDEETAEQVYAASAMAIEVDTAAEQSYLQYLASRLNLDPQRVRMLTGMP